MFFPCGQQEKLQKSSGGDAASPELDGWDGLDLVVGAEHMDQLVRHHILDRLTGGLQGNERV